MKDFLYTLYSNENFPIYLGLFIVILVIAFIVVYYWGKKDQKLIETRKLQKINLENEKNAFKETSKEHKLESEESTIKEKKFDSKEENLKNSDENEKIELPKKVDNNLPKDVPYLEMPKRKNDPSFEYTKTIELPKLNKDSGIKMVNIEDFNLLADSIENELKDIEKLQEKNNQKPEEIEYLYEDTAEIELPKLRR